jgi:hypothetical protein
MDRESRFLKPGKIALVTIDMQEDQRKNMAWGRGCAEEGIILLSSAVSSAREAGIRPVFVVGSGSIGVLDELSREAPGAPVFRKRLGSAFSSWAFRRYLDRLNPDALIIGGWVGHLCVRDTVIDAIRDEYSVFTSGDLIFHRAGSPARQMMDESELRLNSRLLTMYPDAASLLSALGIPFHPPSKRAGKLESATAQPRAEKRFQESVQANPQGWPVNKNGLVVESVDSTSRPISVRRN